MQTTIMTFIYRYMIAFDFVWMFVCQSVASFSSFWQLLYGVQINALSIIKVYIERNNM